MAFAQQHRRPQHRQQRSLSASTDELVSDSQTFAPTSLILSPRVTQPASSDSDNDWHVISSASRTSSTSPSRDSESSFAVPSEPDTSSSLRQSDTESFSDIDTQTSSVRNEFTTLPAHDGTGTFIDEPGYFSDGTNRSQDEVDSPSAFARVVHRMLDNRREANAWRATVNDFAPDSASMPNILLPHGGIGAPSFAANAPSPAKRREEEQPLPSFQPTVPKFQSDNQSDTSASHDAYLSDDVKFTRRRRRNLDSIPSHHPAIPGTMTSAAVLSAVWDQIRRLTSNLLENDASTSETFSNLVSEAAFEGCMPFGSHLHMDFGNSLISAYTGSKRVETWYGA